jgi:hypothetical protein
MKSFIFGMALCAAAYPALAQTNVSINVGQPGFYGQVMLGDFAPRPVLYAPQPVIIAPRPHYAAAPIYLRVPPGHRRDWRRFCGRYDACGRPVLFVRDDWYTNTYVPRYRDYYHGPRHGFYGGPGPRHDVRVVERVEYRGHGGGYGGGYGGGPGRGHWDDRGPGRGHGDDRGHGGGHDRGGHDRGGDRGHGGDHGGGHDRGDHGR